MDFNQWIIIFIFMLTYILIFSEKVHRTTAALFGAVLMVLYGIANGFLDESEAMGFIKWDVIGLLFGMMIIVGILKETGFFEYLAIKIAKSSKGNLTTLLVMFGISTAILSMFVDNVTTILLMIPITVAIAKTLKINPIPIILTIAILSNIGGTATLVGDPPNIIIGSSAYSGFSFNDFLIHLTPIAILILFISVFIFKFFYRDWLKIEPENLEKLMVMEPKDKIKDIVKMKRTLFVLVGTILLFLFHDYFGLHAATVAIIGGAAALLITKADPYKALADVEWPTLLFFAGLFILVGTLEHQKILEKVATQIINISGDSILSAAVIILWFSALGSSIIDRIPFTAAMCPIILHMQDNFGNVNIIWWALAMGVGFGGNGTPIGSSVGVITLGLSERYNYPISMKEWIKKGFPIAVLSCLIATIILILFNGFFK